MKTNWLITGGCGFIGARLVNRLLAEDRPPGIRVLDNLSLGRPEDLAALTSFVTPSFDDLSGPSRRVELIEGDIRDAEVVACALAGIDVVVHLAAHTGVRPSLADPLGDAAVNVAGTLNLLEGARRRGISRVIFASSGAALGETEQPITEERLPAPASPYGAAKLTGEAYCSAYAKSYGLGTLALRFSNVYGPGSKRKESVVAQFMKRAVQGEPLEIFGSGEQVRDFIYVDDLVEAILLGAAADLDGRFEIFQIATQVETSVNALAEMIAEIVSAETGEEIEIRRLPSAAGDLARVYADISKARRHLGFDPQTTLPDGFRNTFRYFAQEAGSINDTDRLPSRAATS
ncbi:MAG: NAD-dependent epimerase/dehydratase family protein [Alphaproteobacteria bacterium]